MDIFVFQIKGWVPSNGPSDRSRPEDLKDNDPREIKQLFAFPCTNIKENLDLLEEHFGEDFTASEFERIVDGSVTLLGVVMNSTVRLVRK